jgi:hypothetical protein
MVNEKKEERIRESDISEPLFIPSFLPNPVHSYSLVTQIGQHLM